jgi:peptide chain release factor subunit 3
MSTTNNDQKSKAKVNKARQKEYIRDPRPHFSVCFTGHVDSGKSTCSGRLLADSGLVEEREMTKLKEQAKKNHREGWEYAYVMDLSEEERAKGKTHEMGSAYLETEHRRITILDAPGHNAFVGSMIGGAAQADIAVMIISAKTGEFEAGFNKGGQTREHTTLCRVCGVQHMIICINKMDDVEWDKERYDQIVREISPFMKQNAFEIGKTSMVMPLSGLTGFGLTKSIPDDVCDWYKGPTLIDYINQFKLPATKNDDDELCIPLLGAYKDEFGKTFIYGKVESGSVVIGDELMLLPGNINFVVEGIQVENTELDCAFPGDNVHIRVRGLDEGQVHAGFVATSSNSTLKAVEYIQARILLLDARNLVSASSKAIMHVHTAAEEITFHSLLAKLDRKTSAIIEERPAFILPGEMMLARLELGTPLVMQEASKFDKLGRFVLRQDSKTIAIGVVTKLYQSTKADITRAATTTSSTNN